MSTCVHRGDHRDGSLGTKRTSRTVPMVHFTTLSIGASQNDATIEAKTTRNGA